MEFYYYTPETFVVLTDDQFVEGDGLLEKYWKFPNKLIVSQHYKRLRRSIIIEFHSLSHFTLTTAQ